MWQVSFGSTMQPKLLEGYVFNTNYRFHIEVVKIEATKIPCTKHWLLNEEYAQRIYDLISGACVVQAEVLLMILQSKTYIGPKGLEVNFLGERKMESFQTVHCVHGDGDGEGAWEAFLRCFT
jgi:hypothetical protein